MLQKIKSVCILCLIGSIILIALNACGDDDPVPVPLPVLSVNPQAIDFDSIETTRTFTIRNTGDGDMSWSCTHSTAAWLSSISPTSGTVTTNTATVSVTVSRAGLSTGDYDAEIYIVSSGGSDTIDVAMSVAATPIPILSFNPDSLDFGSDETQLALQISNVGTGTLNWDVTKASGCDWLSFTPASGSATSDTDQVTVTVDRTGLDPDNYTCELYISSNGGDDTVVVEMTVAAVPHLVVSPDALDFGTGETTLAISISNSGTGTVNWIVSKDVGCSWLGLSPGAGSATTDTDQVVVSVDRSGLATGEYSCDIIVTSNGGSDTVTVTMEVQGDLVVELPQISTADCDAVDAPLTVANFSGIGGLELHIAYDTLQVTCDSVSSTHLSGKIVGISNGMVNIIWADMSGMNPVTVANGAELLTIHFSNLAGTSQLAFAGNNEITTAAGTPIDFDAIDGTMECTGK